MTLIDVKNAVKIYQMGEEKFYALHDVSFSIEEGEFVAIMGTSGSGKSTCMNMLGTLDKPTSGQYHLDGVDVFSLSPNELSDIRNNKIGFVFSVHINCFNSEFEISEQISSFFNNRQNQILIYNIQYH